MSRVCIKDRVCKECSREFVGDRNTCPKCRYSKVKAAGKFGAEYHRKYYRKFLKAGSEPRRTRGDMKDELRRAALARQTERIGAEMEAIRRAGLDPAQSTIQEILDAGVVLDNSTHSDAFERLAI